MPIGERKITVNRSQFDYLLDSLKEAVRNLEKIKAEWDEEERKSH